MERESYKPEELLPASSDSREEFLAKAEQCSDEGYMEKDNGTKVKSYRLPGSRNVTIWRAGVVAEDLYPNQAIAAMIVFDRSKDERTTTRYFHYKDGRMEKEIDVESKEAYEAKFLEAGASLEVVHKAAQEGIKRIHAKLAAEEEERKIGLRTATEADMQEAQAIYDAIEEMQMREGKESE